MIQGINTPPGLKDPPHGATSRMEKEAWPTARTLRASPSGDTRPALHDPEHSHRGDGGRTWHHYPSRIPLPLTPPP